MERGNSEAPSWAMYEAIGLTAMVLTRGQKRETAEAVTIFRERSGHLADERGAE